MKTKILSIIIILILGLLIFSCGTNRSEQANPVDADMLRTEAVSTYASSLTETQAAIPVASPTQTVEQPTPTILADITATLETPQTANACYNLIWIKDVTIPDGQQMKPNEIFTKTWLVQNVGGCTWPAGFMFGHVGGDLMRGQTVKLKEPIPVGAKREISVQLAVPSGINGLIQSSWRMADADGNYFGDTLSVNILVGNITTPAVTNTP